MNPALHAQGPRPLAALERFSEALQGHHGVSLQNAKLCGFTLRCPLERLAQGWSDDFVPEYI